MLHYSYKVILSILISILIAASGLWGLLTYRPGGLRFALLHRAPNGMGGWDAILILTIGVLAGWVTKRYILRRWRLPGSIWTTLAAGVSGAWLGGILPDAWGWVEGGINIPGSIVIAFGMAWAVGQIAARLRKGRGR